MSTAGSSANMQPEAALHPMTKGGVPQQPAYSPGNDELVVLLSAKIDGVPSVGADMVRARRDLLGRVVALFSPHLEGI